MKPKINKNRLAVIILESIWLVSLLTIDMWLMWKGPALWEIIIWPLMIFWMTLIDTLDISSFVRQYKKDKERARKRYLLKIHLNSQYGKFHFKMPPYAKKHLKDGDEDVN